MVADGEVGDGIFFTLGFEESQGTYSGTGNKLVLVSFQLNGNYVSIFSKLTCAKSFVHVCTYISGYSGLAVETRQGASFSWSLDFIISTILSK